MQGAAVVVTSASRGREEEFDELVGPHLEAGYRTALAILRDPDEARDAVQEAALKAWRRLGQLRDGRSARAWFLAIVANQCRSTRRGRWWSVLRVPEVERGSAELDGDQRQAITTVHGDGTSVDLPDRCNPAW